MHLAPTASKRSYRQRVGRVTRRHPGKEAGIVIDFVHPATKHDDPVVTLHSLLDRDVYRGGAIVVGPVRRGRGRRVRVERRVLPVTPDPERRAEVFERELWRIAVEHLDYGEQHVWAALAGARVAPNGWRRAKAMLHFDRGGELKRRFLLTAVQRNRNSQLRLRALQEIAASRDAEAFDTSIDIMAGWPRDERREGVKIMLQALAERRIGRRDQANAWIWRMAEYTREVHEEYAVQRWPETKRLLGLLVNSSGSAHARNARRLVHAAGAASAAARRVSRASWRPPKPIASAVVKTTNVPVRMSDGAVLYVDVVQPADSSGKALPGRYPVLLTQTPYNKNGALSFENDYLVEHGFVQVIADVRGTGSSEGAWDSFGAREQEDGYDLAEWTRTQRWSNGSIGLHGTSYGAINQFLTAERQPAGVKAAFPIVPMSDAYRDVTFGGGDTNTSFIPSWLGLVTALGLLPPTYTPNDPAEAAKVLVQHSGGALSFQAAQVLDSTTGGNAAFDGPFYRVRSPIERISKVRIPTFVVGGRFDLFQRGEPLLYQALRRNGAPTRLLMGPWPHITPGQGLPAPGTPAPA